MKLILNLTLVLFLFTIIISCTSGGISKTESENEIQLYRSTEESFLEDFYLRIDNDTATVYCWIILNRDDTLYYTSSGAINFEDSGMFNLELEDYRITTDKFNLESLDDFRQSDRHDNVKLFFYSGFSANKISDNSIETSAVKPLYSGQSDKFVFERIKAEPKP